MPRKLSILYGWSTLTRLRESPPLRGKLRQLDMRGDTAEPPKESPCLKARGASTVSSTRTQMVLLPPPFIPITYSDFHLN